MPSTPQIIHMRRRRWKKYHDTPAQRSGLGLVLFLSISFIICIFGLTYFYAIVTDDLPSLQSLPLLLEPPDGFLLQPTRFYDRSGTHVIYEVENPAIEERRYIRIGPSSENKVVDDGESLPQSLINATIAISDPSFINHLGFSTFRNPREFT